MGSIRRSACRVLARENSQSQLLTSLSVSTSLLLLLYFYLCLLLLLSPLFPSPLPLSVSLLFIPFFVLPPVSAKIVYSYKFYKISYQMHIINKKVSDWLTVILLVMAAGSFIVHFSGYVFFFVNLSSNIFILGHFKIRLHFSDTFFTVCKHAFLFFLRGKVISTYILIVSKHTFLFFLRV